MYVDTVLDGTTYNLDSILGNEADFWEDGLDLENPKVRMGERPMNFLPESPPSQNWEWETRVW